jgi:tubulin polyglutamylase TTLL6/13
MIDKFFRPWLIEVN